MSSRGNRPPRLAAWLLARVANREEASAIVGDFAEEYREAVERSGVFRARMTYRRLAAASLPSFLKDFCSGSLIMLRNYLTVAVRNVRRHKGFAFINIMGLSVGLAAALLITLFVRHELSFDRFHEKSHRIYRVGSQFGRGAVEGRGAFSAPPLADALRREYPEIEQAARISSWPRNYLLRAGDRRFLEKGLIYADGSLFEVFTIPFLLGDAASALVNPHTVVLTSKAARKYFGGENPVGRTIRFEDSNRDYQVTGVIEDCPANSHFRYSMIASLSSSRTSRSTNWGSHTYFTYITLQDGVAPEQLESKFPEFVKKYYGARMAARTGKTLDEIFRDDENYYAYFLEPLTDIHLSTGVAEQLSIKGNPMVLAVFSAVAIFILLLACINFMNLSTARFSRRAREVGVRKVLGSNRRQLIAQFLGESILLSAGAMILALGVVVMTLPAFSRLADRQMTLGSSLGFGLVPALFGFTVAIGILAGGYPAFFLSSLRPAHAVKSAALSPGRKTLGLRRVLVIVQFVVTAAVLFGTIVVSRQMHLFRSKQLGFDKHHVVVIHRAYSLGMDQAEPFKRELLRHAAVQAVSHTDALPGRHFEPNGHQVVGRPLTEEHVIQTMCADDDFAEIIGLEFVEGRYFSPERSSDPDEVVINRKAARLLEFDEPLGQRFYKTPKTFRTIVGVVEDFHFFSLHYEILPMAIRRWDGSRWFFTAVRLRPGRLQDSLALIEKTWKDFTGGQPFEYSFLDADFDALYRGERRTGRIFGIFSGLAVFVACLGLFGLVSFATEQRTRELGIRKVLGASPVRLIILLSREVVLLIIIAILIALPVASFAMHRWLQSYAYRIQISPVLFLVTALTTLVIALSAVMGQAVRAASADPVETLRCE